MKIRIRANDYNLILQEAYEGKDGEERWKDIGYYTKLPDMLDAVARRLVAERQTRDDLMGSIHAVGGIYSAAKVALLQAWEAQRGE